jgi:DNA-binding XRE family transcriptional regulator
MNLVQSMIKARLKNGKTQDQIARELGVTPKTLRNAYYSKHAPQAKLLTALGIRRDIVYTLIKPSEADELMPDMPRERTGSARKLRQMRKAAVKALPKSAPKVTPAVAAADVKLTAERVQLAVRYGLKPGVAWRHFVSVYAGGDVDASWLEYCEQLGHAPAVAPAPDSAALGKPGELYSHLKPVARGPDLRPATDMSGGGTRVVPRE